MRTSRPLRNITLPRPDDLQYRTKTALETEADAMLPYANRKKTACIPAKIWNMMCRLMDRICSISARRNHDMSSRADHIPTLKRPVEPESRRRVYSCSWIECMAMCAVVVRRTEIVTCNSLSSLLPLRYCSMVYKHSLDPYFGQSSFVTTQPLALLLAVS